MGNLITSTFGIDSENSIFQYFGGIGRAILGERNGKFHLRNRYNQLAQFPQRVSLVDVSFGELMTVALNVPHLNTIISKKAEMFSNMKVKHLDKDGNEIENSPVLKFLANPNPLQSWQEFLYEFSVLDSIYANNFIYMNKTAVDKLPRVLWCLPSGQMRINLTGKIYRQYDLAGIIENYKLMFDDQPYLPQEIIQISIGVKPNMIQANSRIESLQMPLSNIVASLKSLNIIVTEKGLVGIVSSDSGGGNNENSKPLTEKEREHIDKDFKKRRSLDGDQGHVTFSTSSVKWIPMTFDVKQLMLYEGLEDAFGSLCDAFGIHRQVFADSFVHSKPLSGNTDIDAGMRFTYQNTLVPLGTVLLNNFAQRFGITDAGEQLVPEFDLPCMADDELTVAQGELYETQRLQILKNAGVISPEAWAEMEEVEYTGKDNVQPVAAPPSGPPSNEPPQPIK